MKNKIKAIAEQALCVVLAIGVVSFMLWVLSLASVFNGW